MSDLNIDAEITRLLHLAIIAQLQCWDAANNLESLLDSEYVHGSPEWHAVRLHIDGAIQDLASDPKMSLPETLTTATPERLRNALLACAAEAAEASRG